MATVAYEMARPLEQTLHTSALELKYQRSVHLVDIIAKEENIRKLRFDKHVLEDDNIELRDLLSSEQERCDKLEAMVNEHLLRAEDAEAVVQSLEDDLQSRETELSTLRAEAKALQTLTTDTSKLMREKLELTGELSRLKPELEHLRAQVSAHEGLLTDKLALQRKVSEMEVDLENAKRDAKRALAKRRNTMVEAAQEDELEGLRKSIAKEKRMHERAKELVEELEGQIDALKKASAQTAASETGDVERKAETEVRIQELTRELDKEKRERAKVEKRLEAGQTEWESTKTLLEEQIKERKARTRDFRDKLREAEATLEKEREERAAEKDAKAAKGTTAATTKRQTRKRVAEQMEPDATTLGTPGDAPAKRARKGASVGEKSSFSITPFLNRTANVMTSSPAGSGDEDGGADAASPSVPAPTNQATKKRKKQPLQDVTSSKQNMKKPSLLAATSTVTKIPLQVVEEEDEDAESAPNKAAEKTVTAKKQLKPKTKTRKSLAAFPSFALETEPAAERKKGKTRRLGGGDKTGTTTLFDADEDAPKTLGGGLGGFGKLGGFGGGVGALARGGFLAKSRTTADGFTFSPLKKDRKREASMLK